MNKFIISGRLCADPDIRYSQDGKPVAKFNFAVNRRFQKDGEPKADFFQCIAFGKTAETLEKCNVAKGTKLMIDGEMRNNNYEKDGVKHYGMQVIVNAFEFCESKGSTNQQSEHSPYGSAPASYDGFMNIPDGIDEALPFD